MKRVVIQKCDDYQQNKVDSAINNSIELLGGIEKYIRKGDRVFLKVNLLKKNFPDDAVTTHPAIVEAMVKQVQKAGGIPVIGDSPGGPFSERSLKGIYSATGMSYVAEKTGAILNYDTDEVTDTVPDGKILKTVTYMKVIKESDVVINIPKLKTHGMTVYTGAVKNLFGVIPGFVKAGYHLNLTDVRDFSDMLIDLNLFIKPSLSIMDGIIGMEGNGPSAGNPKKIGIVLASDDTFSLDTISASVIGLKTNNVPTLFKAAERNLGLINEIQVLGEKLSDVQIEDFDIPRIRGFVLTEKMPGFLAKYMERHVKLQPIFIQDICKKCGICVSNCPPKALTMGEKAPFVDLEKCIRCFCCQELCPHKAVKIKKPIMSRFLFR